MLIWTSKSRIAGVRVAKKEDGIASSSQDPRRYRTPRQEEKSVRDAIPPRVVRVKGVLEGVAVGVQHVLPSEGKFEFLKSQGSKVYSITTYDQ